jgi:hypothetical protein
MPCVSSERILTNREVCHQKSDASYTNWYTNPPETTVNNEQPYTVEFGLEKRILEQPVTTTNILRLSLNL